MPLKLKISFMIMVARSLLYLLNMSLPITETQRKGLAGALDSHNDFMKYMKEYAGLD